MASGGPTWQDELHLALLTSFRLSGKPGDGSLCIRPLTRRQHWQRAVSLLSQLRTVLRLGVVAYNSVASATLRAGLWLQAGHCLEAGQIGQRDRVSGNVALNARLADWRAASQVFADLWGYKLADQVVFTRNVWGWGCTISFATPKLVIVLCGAVARALRCFL